MWCYAQGYLILEVSSGSGFGFILVHYDTLLQNVTNIITKCDIYFITKCDKSLLQNMSGFLLQNASFITNATFYYKMRWEVVNECLCASVLLSRSSNGLGQFSKWPRAKSSLLRQRKKSNKKPFLIRCLCFVLSSIVLYCLLHIIANERYFSAL